LTSSLHLARASPAHKFTVQVGPVKIIVTPITEATTSSAPSRPRARRGNGTFAPSAESALKREIHSFGGYDRGA
jgi:hypothetical protein